MESKDYLIFGLIITLLLLIIFTQKSLNIALIENIENLTKGVNMT